MEKSIRDFESIESLKEFLENNRPKIVRLERQLYWLGEFQLLDKEASSVNAVKLNAEEKKELLAENEDFVGESGDFFKGTFYEWGVAEINEVTILDMIEELGLEDEPAELLEIVSGDFGDIEPFFDEFEASEIKEGNGTKWGLNDIKNYTYGYLKDDYSDIVFIS